MAYSVEVQDGDDLEVQLSHWTSEHISVLRTVFQYCGPLNTRMTIVCDPSDSGKFKIPRMATVPDNLHETLKHTHKNYYRFRKQLPRGDGSPGGVCRGSGGFACEGKVLKMLHTNEKFRALVCKILGLSRDDTRFEKNTDSRRVSRNIFENPDKQLTLGNNTGDTIADIFAYGPLNLRYPISVKSTCLTTFANIGVSQCLNEEEIKRGLIQNPLGSLILKELYINVIGFCNIFNNYNLHKNSQMSLETLQGENKVYNHESTDPSTMEALSQSVDMFMGQGDYGVIHKIGRTYKIHKKQPCGNIHKAVWKYGGGTGMAKGLYILLYTGTMKYTINIRNKQGGIYPSHIMCDFKRR